MRFQSKRRRWNLCCMLATLLVVAGFAPSRAQAGKPGSLDFTIKADYDGRTGSNSYTVTGAIEDTGSYGVLDEDRYVDENGETWTRFRFVSSQGIFYIGWLPPDYGSGVHYPVELMPGTGAYANVQGTGTFRLRVRNKYEWVTGGWGQRDYIIVYSVEHITVTGSLLP